MGGNIKEHSKNKYGLRACAGFTRSNDMVEQLKFLLCIREVPVQTSAWKVPIPNEVFSGFSQSLKANVGIAP
jgi:hypothetical protein